VSNIYDSSAQLAELVEEADWLEITRRLLAYATFELSQYASLKDEMRTPHDYVVKAVTSLLDGELTSSRGGDKPLFKALAVIVARLIREDVEQARRSMVSVIQTG